ncbi:MAG: S-layer homology domain-containing protein, partial [Clostridiales bacterium]|nr:S-layer homology domain-containing protein [Clostridiales bacterium]
MQKKMKVMIISILFMGLLTLNSIAIGFSDVSDNQWFYNSVTKMTEQGIFKGYPDGTFKPDNTVTYGEFIKMFVVAVTGTDPGNSSSGHWAKNYYDK